ncbi:sensor histidine kinase [Consotaella aegiceratis]|uniref:sensor histidine kinase n=1 Tax=Consotaella aegiceratis TaxID=3097961 RepID=UPI002F402A28
MKQTDAQPAARPGFDARGFLELARNRFAALVCPAVSDPAERELQARAIRGLILAGLAAALASPLGVVAGWNVAFVVTPLFASVLLLSAASFLAFSGRYDLVTGSLFLLWIAGVGLGASVDGGAASPLLWLLALAPIEAVAQQRRSLQVVAATGSVAVLAVLSVMRAAGLDAPIVDWPRAGGVAAGCAALYALSLAARRLTPAATAVATEALDSAERRIADREGAEMLLRFDENGRLISASRAVAARLGAPALEMAAEALLERIHLTDRVSYLQAIGAMAAGRDTTEIAIRMRTGAESDRGLTTFAVRFFALRAEDGRLGEILAFLSETEAAGEDRETLRRALEETRQASEAKSHFLAAVSHELRTPLNAIIGFSDILQMEYYGRLQNDQQREYVGLIRQSGHHLLSVVNSLLDMSKIEAGRYELCPEPFALSEVVTATVDMMRAEADKKGLSLDLRLADDDVTVTADKRACQQILINLLANAIKFTDKGMITLESRLDPDGVAMVISDTGIGIAECELDRIGKPFTQLSTGLSRQYPGTGLGLSLVKGFCDLHHGRMSIASQMGVGTAVTVRLPLDCTATDETSTEIQDKIVTLTDARKKTNSRPQDSKPHRATA